MVAIASRPAPTVRAARHSTARGWLIASAVAIAGGVIVRLLIDPGVGGRSAAVMSILLGLVVCTAARLVSSPRTAFFTTLGLTILLDLAVLPTRTPEFDDREALFKTDQVISVQPLVPAGGASVMTLLAEAVFKGPQPAFELVADVNGRRFSWQCAFEHRRQRLALPLPDQFNDPVDVTLRLTGSPARDGDYLLVYSSSLHGGPLVMLVDPSGVPPDASRCSAGPG